MAPAVIDALGVIARDLRLPDPGSSTTSLPVGVGNSRKSRSVGRHGPADCRTVRMITLWLASPTSSSGRFLLYGRSACPLQREGTARPRYERARWVPIAYREEDL